MCMLMLKTGWQLEPCWPVCCPVIHVHDFLLNPSSSCKMAWIMPYLWGGAVKAFVNFSWRGFVKLVLVAIRTRKAGFTHPLIEICTQEYSPMRKNHLCCSRPWKLFGRIPWIFISEWRLTSSSCFTATFFVSSQLRSINGQPYHTHGKSSGLGITIGQWPYRPAATGAMKFGYMVLQRSNWKSDTNCMSSHAYCT